MVDDEWQAMRDADGMVMHPVGVLVLSWLAIASGRMTHIQYRIVGFVCQTERIT